MELTIADKIYLAKLLYSDRPISESYVMIDNYLVSESASTQNIAKALKKIASILLGPDAETLRIAIKQRLKKEKPNYWRKLFTKKQQVSSVDMALCVYGLWSRFSFVRSSIKDPSLNLGGKVSNIGFVLGVSPKVRDTVENSTFILFNTLFKNAGNKTKKFLKVIAFFVGDIVESSLLNIIVRISNKAWSKVVSIFKFAWNKFLKIIRRENSSAEVTGEEYGNNS